MTANTSYIVYHTTIQQALSLATTISDITIRYHTKTVFFCFTSLNVDVIICGAVEHTDHNISAEICDVILSAISQLQIMDPQPVPNFLSWLFISRNGRDAKPISLANIIKVYLYSILNFPQDKNHLFDVFIHPLIVRGHSLSLMNRK